MVSSLMTIWDYNTHISYADLEDWVINCYLILCQAWKWTKKPFFHFSGMIFLDIFLLFTACVSKMTHKDFGLYLINWKGKGLPHTFWHLGRPSYMNWSELHQSSAISFLQTVSLSLFCMWNKKKFKSSAQSVMWDCILVNAVRTATKQRSCEYQ